MINYAMQLIFCCRSYLHVYMYTVCNLVICPSELQCTCTCLFNFMSKYLALCVVKRSFVASLAVPVARITCMYVQGGGELQHS